MIAPQELDLGQTITLEGYADDFDKSIVAMEFSLDGGETWTSHNVSDTTADLWVHWTYSFTPEERGAYQLKVRSVNERGQASPQAAVAEFYVR